MVSEYHCDPISTAAPRNYDSLIARLHFIHTGGHRNMMLPVRNSNTETKSCGLPFVLDHKDDGLELEQTRRDLAFPHCCDALSRHIGTPIELSLEQPFFSRNGLLRRDFPRNESATLVHRLQRECRSLYGGDLASALNCLLPRVPTTPLAWQISYSQRRRLTCSGRRLSSTSKYLYRRNPRTYLLSAILFKWHPAR